MQKQVPSLDIGHSFPAIRPTVVQTGQFWNLSVACLFKVGMYSGPEVHGVSPRRISVWCFWDFSTETKFHHDEDAAARKVRSHAGGAQMRPTVT